MENVDMKDLSNELIYRRYLMNSGKTRLHFKDLNVAEYIALHIVAEAASEDTIYGGRTYLKDLADKMQLSIHQISQLVGGLRDRGLLNWAHDGNGSDGTYVIITDTGIKLLRRQEQMLKDFHQRVIEKYGKDNMIQLLQMMKRLETVMSSELEETEEPPDGIGTQQ